jgi:hypothetical protein
MPHIESEKEKKTKMLLTFPDYKLPENVSPLDRASIMARIDQEENNPYGDYPLVTYGKARDNAKKSPIHGGKKTRRKLRRRKSNKRK